MNTSRRSRIATLIASAAAGVALAVWGAGAPADGGGRALARASASTARAFELAWNSTSWFAGALVCAGDVAAVPLGARWDARREATTLEWCERQAAPAPLLGDRAWWSRPARQAQPAGRA